MNRVEIGCTSPPGTGASPPWNGALELDQALERLRHLPYEDLGYAQVDHHRSIRQGFPEVIFGKGKTPEQIVGAALQEDADVIGLSILSGAHMHICPRVMDLLRENGLTDVLVVVGGIIPDADVPRLNAVGVQGIFQPGTPMQEIVDFINRHARTRVGTL